MNIKNSILDDYYNNILNALDVLRIEDCIILGSNYMKIPNIKECSIISSGCIFLNDGDLMITDNNNDFCFLKDCQDEL